MYRLLPFLLLIIGQHALGQSTDYFQYSLLPDLPSNAGYPTQKGLAGLYAGIDDDVLIVAGGANFPEQLPWEGGTKVYYDEIFILQKKGQDEYAWISVIEKLPLKAAYGAAISTAHGLFCFGGNTEHQIISESWFINYTTETGKVEIIKGPNLPVPLTHFAFSKLDNIIYVAGGVSSNEEGSGNFFFKLDLSRENFAEWNWETLESWDGEPRAFAVSASQNNGSANCFYLFSGRNVQPNLDQKALYDAHEYNPALNVWSIVSDGMENKFPFMAGTAFPLGASTIVFSSGADGVQMMRQKRIENEIERLGKTSGSDVGDNSKLDSLHQILLEHLNNHPGFGKQMFAFNTLTHEVYEIDSLPRTEQLTATAIKWGDDIIIPSGEIRPGVRTPKILKIAISGDKGHLSAWDIFVIALYFLVLARMGYFFSKRQRTTNDYFKGGGRIPWWAAGISLFGTALSAITFMAIPAKTFATDWSYLMLNMTIFLVAPIIVFLFIPLYRKLNVTTAYQYLELRFNIVVRSIGSLSFILFQIGRMGVVLFLPSIALNVVTGIDIFVCIALMGIVSLLYTMMGGIEAVIWTDVMQVIVLLGGALLSLGLMISAIDGGFQTIVDTALAENKFHVFDLTWSLRQPGLWVMLIGGTFANITMYGTDQTMVQRYLTTKTKREANKTVWTNALMTIPASLLFFFAGTALFVFFKSDPAALNPTFDSNDTIFPWYIVSQMPSGLAGLLIAAIFAAAMSSLSSSMNSAATAYATDIHFRFRLNKTEDQLKIARRATLVLGMIGILFAFIMAAMDVKSLWDEFQRVLGLIIGSLGGVFLLGILSKRANSTGALIGLGVSVAIQVVVGYYQPVHLLLFASTGVLSCYISGYIASLIFTKRH